MLANRSARSAKTQIATFTGTSLCKALTPASESDAERFSFSKQGTLHVQPYDSKGGTPLAFHLNVPQVPTQYSHLAVAVRMSSKDFTGVKVTYGKQTDTIKRSGTAAEELFGFDATAEGTVTLEIAADKYKKVPAEITEIRIYGINNPVYYKSGERQ